MIQVNREDVDELERLGVSVECYEEIIEVRETLNSGVDIGIGLEHAARLHQHFGDDVATLSGHYDRIVCERGDYVNLCADEIVEDLIRANGGRCMR